MYTLLTDLIIFEFDIFESNLINLLVLGGIVVNYLFFPRYHNFSKRKNVIKSAFIKSMKAEEILRLGLMESYFQMFLKNTFVLITLAVLAKKFHNRQLIIMSDYTIDPIIQKTLTPLFISPIYISYVSRFQAVLNKYRSINCRPGFTRFLENFDQLWKIAAIKTLKIFSNKTNYHESKRRRCLKNFLYTKNLLIRRLILSDYNRCINDLLCVTYSAKRERPLRNTMGLTLGTALILESVKKDFTPVQNVLLNVDSYPEDEARTIT